MISGTKSSWKPITSGVIQGSVLGPLFYILYSNDLVESIINHGFLYADDTNIVSISPTPPTINTHPHLQLDLNNIYQWTETWKSPLNLAKCFSMHISRPCSHIDPSYTMNNTPITPCKIIKNLGVYLSYDLSWSHHVQTLASETMHLVRQVQHSLPTPTASTISKLYKSLIRPKLEYANNIWLPGTDADLTTIENVQRKATKWGSLRHRSYPERLNTLSLTSLDKRRVRQDCILLYKHFMNLQPTPFINPPFLPQRQQRGHKYRYSCEAATHHTFPPRYSFLTNRTAAHWNSLPNDVINATSLQAFKSEYDKHIGII
jgi:hypothetical protein